MVLNSGDVTFASPVDGSGNLDSLLHVGDGVFDCRFGVQSQVGLEFFFGPVGELVDSLFVRDESLFVEGVVLFDRGYIVLEDVVTGSFFYLVFVGFAVVSLIKTSSVWVIKS